MRKNDMCHLGQRQKERSNAHGERPYGSSKCTLQTTVDEIFNDFHCSDFHCLENLFNIVRDDLPRFCSVSLTENMCQERALSC